MMFSQVERSFQDDDNVDNAEDAIGENSQVSIFKVHQLYLLFTLTCIVWGAFNVLIILTISLLLIVY